MSLSIIFDKSAFQAFNKQDVSLLYRYFTPNIPPILIMEILGDLSKEYGDAIAPVDKVQQLANKLLPTNSAVNANHLRLISDELSGAKIMMDHRPFVGNTTVVKSASGAFGMKIAEAAEEVAVRRWKDGQFTDIEELIAHFWRQVTKQEDLLEKLKESITIDSDELKLIKSFQDAIDYVDRILSDSGKQTNLLNFAIIEFNVAPMQTADIFLRWTQMASESLLEFAPYTFFCVRVVLLFHIALKKGLVGTRPTNQLDLEYLFYLPFCLIFITDDKFQMRLAQLLKKDNQSLIKGSDLKKDLTTIHEYILTVGQRKDIERLRNEPPQISELLTYKLWNKYLHWPKRLFKSKALDPEELKKKMDDFSKATETREFIGVDSDGLDFIVKQSFLRPTDPCPCGSGKQIKDCHLSPDYSEK